MNGGVYELDFVASICPSLNNSSVEKDLKDLKELYYERNSVALDDAVSKETTRDYKKFLLTLLNNSSVEKDLKDLKELYYERNSVALERCSVQGNNKGLQEVPAHSVREGRLSLNNSSVEKDLKDLKELYYERNSVALDDAVSKETTGDYKKFLLTLFGKED
nr:annexin D7-like [Quercus suber]